MPRKTDNIAIADVFLKRSAKLLPCQKEMMHYWHERELGIRAIARMFHCNKRTVQFELFPERHKRNLQLRKARGGSNVYYKKDEHTPAVKKHRQYKKQLFDNLMNKSKQQDA